MVKDNKTNKIFKLKVIENVINSFDINRITEDNW